MNQRRIATVFIPVAGSIADQMIAPGSAIAGLQRDQCTQFVVYYEGNMMGASNLSRYRERLMCAAGRMFTRYPTVALMGFSPEDMPKNFVAVGSIDDSYKFQLDDEAALNGYLGSEDTIKRRLAAKLPALETSVG